MAMSEEPVLVEFRDASYVVGGFTYQVCGACGEELHPAGQVDAIHRVAVDMARRDRGLLTPKEILRLRAELGLTQVALEGILSVGPKSVTRWENGTVFQSALADKFMRAIQAHPEIFGAQRRIVATMLMERPAMNGYATVAKNLSAEGMKDNDLALAA